MTVKTTLRVSPTQSGQWGEWFSRHSRLCDSAQGPKCCTYIDVETGITGECYRVGLASCLFSDRRCRHLGRRDLGVQTNFPETISHALERSHRIRASPLNSVRPGSARRSDFVFSTRRPPTDRVCRLRVGWGTGRKEVHSSKPGRVQVRGRAAIRHQHRHQMIRLSRAEVCGIAVAEIRASHAGWHGFPVR